MVHVRAQSFERTMNHEATKPPRVTAPARVRECKEPSAPGEVSVKALSDGGSTPPTSTTAAAGCKSHAAAFHLCDKLSEIIRTRQNGDLSALLGLSSLTYASKPASSAPTIIRNLIRFGRRVFPEPEFVQPRRKRREYLLYCRVFQRRMGAFRPGKTVVRIIPLNLGKGTGPAFILKPDKQSRTVTSSGQTEP